MALRGCGSFHFISSIKNGEVTKVHNMDTCGIPRPKFKKLEEVYQNGDFENTSLQLANRETKERNSYVVEDYEPAILSKDDSLEELTLSQIKKRIKRKKRKASESVLLTSKAEDGDCDLTEPLCKFRVKGSKSSRSKRVSSQSEDFAIVKVKVEVFEDECFESGYDLTRGKSESLTNEALFDSLDDIKEMGDEENIQNVNRQLSILSSPMNDSLYKNPTVSESDHISVAQDSDLTVVDYEEVVGPVKAKLPISEEGEKCELNEACFDSLDDIKNMEMDNEETIASYCSQSVLYLQQTPEQVESISAVQDLTSKIDNEHSEEVVSMDAKSPISEENKSLQSMNTDEDSNSNSDSVSLVFKGIAVPANADSEVKLDYNDKKTEIRQPERLPLTRKFISPNSQEKLCHAMKNAESLDDMDHFKCMEKLNFGDQAENKFTSTKSDIEDLESNSHSQNESQLIQNKAVMISKHVFKKPRSFKKGSPTKKGVVSKGCLDGPRLCRSLPRFSSGCTSIEGCSESAIAFSQRQMHDIESLASKLMSELSSMKTVVEEKMLYEGYRSTSLKTEADEILQVKSVIKSATKTEETAKKWLSMMARDCNRFCKIMKMNEDQNTSASGDPALENINQDKPLEKEKKKISFADEAGGTLCDIKLYQIEEESESSLP